MEQKRAKEEVRIALDSIVEFLDDPIDILHFRSLCRYFRNSIPLSFFNNSLSPVKNLPVPYPIRLWFQSKFSNDQINSINITVSKSFIYLFKPKSDDGGGNILARVEYRESQLKLCVSNLFSQPENTNLVPEFFSLNNYEVVKVSKSYANNHDFDSASDYESGWLRLKKVIVYSDSSWTKSEEDRTIFAIIGFGILGCWRFENKHWIWTSANDEHHDCNWKYYRYSDIILYNEKLYVVDEWGTLFVLEFSSKNTRKVAAPLYDDYTWTKYLVESSGDLYLVQVFCEDGIRVRIHKFNDKEHDWDSVVNIGDRMFFVGSGFNCSFSISAQDFPGSKGNFIFFNIRENYRKVLTVIGLFNVEDSKFTSLPDDMPYFDRFNPTNLQKVTSN